MKRVLVLAAIALAATSVRAQTFPERSLQLLIPFGAGNQIDSLARGLAEALAEPLKQSVVVVNRDGAGGTIMATQLSQSRPDGYTLGFGAQGQITLIPHQRDVPYSIDSFDYVCQVFEAQLAVAVAPNSRFKTLKEIADEARANPDKLTWGDAGIGTGPNVLMREFVLRADIKLRYVPYRVVGEMYRDLLNGTIDAVVTSPGSVGPAGARIVGVFGTKREPRFPGAPTAAELGWPVSIAGFGGIYMPKGAPADVRAKLTAACKAAVESPKYRELADRLASPAAFLDGDAYGARMRQDHKDKGELLEKIGLKKK